MALTMVTWLAAAILNAGSVTVFVLFLRDLRQVLPPATGDEDGD
jgi:hypothetical protein